MNERIKELIAQVGGIGHDDDGNELTPALVGKSLESFAELILEEVFVIINDPKNYNNCVYTTFDSDRADGVARQLAKKIKEHFKDTE